MNRVAVIGFLLSLFFSQLLFAHGSGHEPTSQQKLLGIGVSISRGFADIDPQFGFGKMPADWGFVKIDSASVCQRGGVTSLSMLQTPKTHVYFIY